MLTTNHLLNNGSDERIEECIIDIRDTFSSVLNARDKSPSINKT